MKWFFSSINIALLSTFLPSASLATTIYNMTAIPQSIDVWKNEQFIPEAIPAGKSLYISSDSRVRYAGLERPLEVAQEYAIWDNGVFVIQKRTH